MEKAIIGGTGVYDVNGEKKSVLVNTEYGNVEVDVIESNGEEIGFIARHGKKHSIPPHKINYRANIMALKKLGVKYIYATAAVGSCNKNFCPGDIVIVDDFLDFTKSRINTFYEGENGKVLHLDMSEPYCYNLSEEFMKAAKKLNINIKGKAVYVCTEGPRFETRQEIKAFQLLGGDVVGMTSVPEVMLARELGICYTTAAIITNWCTGISNIDMDNISEIMENGKENVTSIFMEAFSQKFDFDDCKCRKYYK